MPAIDSPEAFKSAFDVSRETVDRLKLYEIELKRWQKAFNLIAPSTLDNIWHRHFADSAQLIDLIPVTSRRIADVGSGAGFPGLILALMCENRRDLRVTLVESDTRKAAFLRESARRMEIAVEILSTRIESNASVNQLIGVDTVTARAFAPLSRLFDLVSPVFSSHTVGVFLKGRHILREIEQAEESWLFDVELHDSMTEAAAKIAVVRDLKRKPEGTA
ncbi:MAG: 16S rRNA (guanine(527)-N(7))-methyltransferase RsmG [Hyphomicrobiaceae bacterium]